MSVINYSSYNQADFNENSYSLIPEGKYRVRIEEAKERTSQSGKQMIELTLAVSGYSSKLWGYIILDNSSLEATKKTNQALGTVFTASTSLTVILSWITGRDTSAALRSFTGKAMTAKTELTSATSSSAKKLTSCQLGETRTALLQYLRITSTLRWRTLTRLPLIRTQLLLIRTILTAYLSKLSFWC